MRTAFFDLESSFAATPSDLGSCAEMDLIRIGDDAVRVVATTPPFSSVLSERIQHLRTRSA